MEKVIRKAARTIIYDKDADKIAVLEVNNGAFHKIPGGGVEDGETIEMAAIREAREEGACDIEIVKMIGVSDLRDTGDPGMLDQSHCFLALKTKNHESNKFTDKEKKDSFRLLWLGIDEAIGLFEGIKSQDPFELTMNGRDLEFIRKAKPLIENLK